MRIEHTMSQGLIIDTWRIEFPFKVWNNLNCRKLIRVRCPTRHSCSELSLQLRRHRILRITVPSDAESTIVVPPQCAVSVKNLRCITYFGISGVLLAMTYLDLKQREHQSLIFSRCSHWAISRSRFLTLSKATGLKSRFHFGKLALSWRNLLTERWKPETASSQRSQWTTTFLIPLDPSVEKRN